VVTRTRRDGIQRCSIFTGPRWVPSRSRRRGAGGRSPAATPQPQAVPSSRPRM
jgi:hypothetical protein